MKGHQSHTLEVLPLEENPNFKAFRWSWSASAVALLRELETWQDPDSSTCCCCCCLRASALYCIKQSENEVKEIRPKDDEHAKMQRLKYIKETKFTTYIWANLAISLSCRCCSRFCRSSRLLEPCISLISLKRCNSYEKVEVLAKI